MLVPNEVIETSSQPCRGCVLPLDEFGMKRGDWKIVDTYPDLRRNLQCPLALAAKTNMRLAVCHLPARRVRIRGGEFVSLHLLLSLQIRKKLVPQLRYDLRVPKVRAWCFFHLSY